MSYRPLGQFSFKPNIGTLAPAPAPTTKTLATVSAPTLTYAPKPMLAPAMALAPKPMLIPVAVAKPGVVSSVVASAASVAARPSGVSVSAPVKLVTSEDRSLAASKMAARIADRIRLEKVKLSASSAPRKSLDSAETRIRALALMLPLKRMSLAAAYAAVNTAQFEVTQGRLDARARNSLLASIQALRAAIAPPVRSTVTVVTTSSVRVSAPQATTIQGAVDAAISKLAASGTPVTEANVKQTATEIIKDVSPDTTQAATMVASLNQSPLVVGGAAKTDDSQATQTLTSAPLPTESVTALVESADAAPPAPEPAADKSAEAVPPPTPDDLVAAPPPADAEKKPDEEPTSLVAPAPVTEAAAKKPGLFGVPWLYVGLGAGALVVGGIIMSRRPAPTPNRRKRVSRNKKRTSRRAR